MKFRKWLENAENKSFVWHVTDTDSARDIMQNGFKPMSERWGEGFAKERGVSVSVNPRSAAALLRALQRMNSFKNYEDVIKEIHRVLKSKGRVFLKELSDNECNKDNKYIRRGDDVIKFGEKQLYDLLTSNGFEKVETYTTKTEEQNVEHVVVIGRKK